MTKEEKLAAIAAAKAERNASGAQAPVAPLTPDQKRAAIEAAKAEQNEPSMASKMLSAAGKHNGFFAGLNYAINGPGLDQLTRAVDYGDGFTRTGAAQLADLAQNGGQKHVTSEDWKKAAQGKAPRLAEYARRMGANDGITVDVPGFGPVSQLDLEGNAGEMAVDPLMWADPALKGLKGVQELINPARNATKALGGKVFRSGVKSLDLEAAKYGKEPMSDVLMKHGIWGSPQSMQVQMDELGEKLLGQKRDIVNRGTRNGAEVDMDAAIKRAQDYVDEMRKTNHPEMKDAIDALQKRIDSYKGMGAKESEQTLRTLPYTAEEKQLVPQNELFGYKTNETPLKHEFDLQGRTSIPEKATGTGYYTPSDAGSRSRLMPMGTDGVPTNSTDAIRLARERMPRVNPEAELDIINNATDEVIGLPQSMHEVQVRTPKVATVMDQTERVAGPHPTQVDQWKSSNNGALPENIWQQLNTSGKGAGFDKALNGGLRDEVERAVSNPKYGKDGMTPFNARSQGEELHQVNDELGRILTTQERAERDAAIAERKNFVTPVDTALLGTNPWVAAAKKAGDIAVRPSVRTGLGLGLDHLGNTRIPDALARKLFIDAEQDIPEYLRRN